MSLVNGTVEKVQGKFLTVNGDSFGAFKPEQLKGAEAGDVVQFDYKVNGKYKNISGDVTIIKKSQGTPTQETGSRPQTKTNFRGNGEAGGFPLHAKCYERALDRRNATQVAATLKPKSVEELIELAKKIEAYTTGDLDSQAEKLASLELLGK